MQREVWLIGSLVLGLVAAGLILIGGLRSVRAGAPPLSIEDLLDEELPAAAGKKEKILADNHSCHVCHGNYEEEPLALIHAQQNVGCIDCHGPSYDHRNDEDNITPPDIMFALEDIDRQCAKCHETHDAPAHKVIALWQERCPAKTDPEQLVCTDCHGEHRLKFRTVWWDKKTRKLAIREEGQAIKKAADLTRPPETGAGAEP